MRAARVVLVAVSFAALLAAPARVFANADADADAIPVGNGVESVVSNEETGEHEGRRGRTKSDCTWRQVEPDVAAISEAEGGYSEADGAAEPVWVAPRTPGTWYWVDCAWGERYLVFVHAGAAISPVRLAHQAKKHLDLTAPVVSLRPNETQLHVVNSETWLHVADWGPRQSTVSVPGVSVTVEAVPVRVEWTIEDGTYDERGTPNTQKVTCHGPGTAFRDDQPEEGQTTDCGWVWPRASARSPDDKLGITAVVFYRVTWSAVGAPGGGVFDELDSAPATSRVVVEEIQTQYRRR